MSISEGIFDPGLRAAHDRWLEPPDDVDREAARQEREDAAMDRADARRKGE